MEFLGISLTEWSGYLASLFVLLAFLMKNIKTLRCVNSVGCVFFVIYGILLESWPVVITNAAIIGVNLYYLLRKRDKAVSTHEVKA
ncbi:YgjV family protein [Zunongwangia sp. H14]|uniref:YgjV family protein n=1 Tax=Zunongwangia sp. H14 TaxID=3240792 RepID=UPI00356223D8